MLIVEFVLVWYLRNRSGVEWRNSPWLEHRNILALDVAGFTQALSERSHEVHSSPTRPLKQEPNHRHRRLLRTRRERPRYGRSPNPFDQIASSHCPIFGAGPRPRSFQAIKT
jgi:hypothetical protein